MARLIKKLFWDCFSLWNARNENALPFWSLDRIVDLQNRRVRAIVSHAYSSVPFYREAMDRAGLGPADFHTAEDLAKLPVVTGESIAEAPDRFLSRLYAGGRSLSLYSSGTSGRAKNICYDRAALFSTMAYGHRHRRVLAGFLGQTLAYREMNICPPQSISIQLRKFYEEYSWVPGSMDFKRSILSPSGRIDENLRKINVFKPDLIRGIGSYIGVLFRAAYENGFPLHRPRAVLYGADRMPDHDKELIENHFGVHVLSSYQAAEALRIAYQCEKKECFHINMDHTAVRVVDDKGSAMGPGERGEIIISNLINRATVILNYKLGDLVTLGRSACPCGRTLPSLSCIEGRNIDLIRLETGEIIHTAILLADIHAIEGIIQVQLIQENVNVFSVLVVCIAGMDWTVARRKIQAVVGAHLGDRIQAKIEPVREIPREQGGKVRSFISQCRS